MCDAVGFRSSSACDIAKAGSVIADVWDKGRRETFEAPNVVDGYLGRG